MSPQGAAHVEGEAANRFVVLVGWPTSTLVFLVFRALFGELVGNDTEGECEQECLLKSTPVIKDVIRS